MSPSSPQPHEPTMEEILASIRKIISEDQGETAPTPTPPAPVAAVAPMNDDEHPEEADVLELTHEVQEEAPAPQPEPEPEVQVQAQPEQVAAAAANAGSEVPAADDVAFADSQEEQPAMAGNDLISDNARRAMNKAFDPYAGKVAAAPASAPAVSAAPSMPAMDGNQLESVFSRAVMQSFDPVLRDWMTKNAETVVQSMKPMIREWMDENLPDLIERAVKSEMAPVVRMVTKKS